MIEILNWAGVVFFLLVIAAGLIGSVAIIPIASYLEAMGNRKAAKRLLDL